LEDLDWTASLTGIAKVPPKEGETIPMKQQQQKHVKSAKPYKTTNSEEFTGGG